MIKTWIIIQCSFLNFFLFLSFSPSSSLLILPEGVVIGFGNFAWAPNIIYFGGQRGVFSKVVLGFQKKITKDAP